MEQKREGCCTPTREGADVRPSAVSTVFLPAAAGSANDGMVALPGGRFLMGTEYPYGFPNDGEGPVRPVRLSAFLIDAMPVTNSQFTEFVAATGYQTEAEQHGWSFVFWSQLPELHFERLVEDTLPGAPWWCKVHGARWNNPEGPGSNLLSRADHPVVHVSHNDARAYAQWSGKQLPTEAQWEYAARGGHEQALYPWGNELTPGGKHLCNIWQGAFPVSNSGEDGFTGASSVQAFPPNDFGLYSATGNVWEWAADWFSVDHACDEKVDPLGSSSGSNRVLKGGSFLCHASYCNRYRVAARTQNTPDSATSNIGFRCVKPLEQGA